MSSWWDGGSSGGEVDLAELLDGQAAQGLRELAETGALVSFGLMSDGGAMHVTVTADGRKNREYFRERETLLAWIGEGILALRDAPAPASSPRRGRNGSRRPASA